MPRRSHVALPSLVRLSAQRCKKSLTLIMVQISIQPVFDRRDFSRRREALHDGCSFLYVSKHDMILEEYKISFTERPASRATNLVLEILGRVDCRAIAKISPVDFPTVSRTELSPPIHGVRIDDNILKKSSRSFALLIKQRLPILFSRILLLGFFAIIIIAAVHSEMVEG